MGIGLNMSEWRVLHDSIAGTSHALTGMPCQDNCDARQTRPAQEEFLVLVCADGAGSASLSHVGSSLACQRFLEVACAELQNGASLSTLDESVLAQWIGKVRDELQAEAKARGIVSRELACTLLTAIVGESEALFGQVGDGVIVIQKEGGYAPIFWPQNGEYANTTHFITDADWEATLQKRRWLGRLEEVALLTDGLQMLALNFGTRSVHSAFFAPFFDALRTAEAHDELRVPLRQFLNSPLVNARTDDDKTLMLATRARRDAPSIL